MTDLEKAAVEWRKAHKAWYASPPADIPLGRKLARAEKALANAADLVIAEDAKAAPQ